jgi:trk system potassium uptake protein TrkA
LGELLPKATIIEGNILEQEVRESQKVSDADALISLTGFDELNMIIFLYGTSHHIPQVITKLSDTDNRDFFGNLPLGGIISPRELVCSNIVRYVRAMENQTGAAISVHTIADGQVEAMEFLVDEHTKNCGKPLKELRLKPGVLVVSISHGANTEIANGNSVFQKGDIVVVVDSNSREIIRQLNDIFA